MSAGHQGVVTALDFVYSGLFLVGLVGEIVQEFMKS